MAIAILLLAALFYPAGTSSAQDDGQLSPAMSGVQECLSLSHRLDVMMVIDESTSLGRSDDEALRVTGIQKAIRSLGALSQKSAGAGVQVSLMLAAFGDGFDEVTDGFVTVNGESVPTLIEVAEDFRDRHYADLTDFETAYGEALD
ncbi:MAG: hypothetical protein ACK5LJ_08365, partial [Paracoccus sp. (in: a-proteobacteria)]